MTFTVEDIKYALKVVAPSLNEDGGMQRKYWHWLLLPGDTKTTLVFARRVDDGSIEWWIGTSPCTERQVGKAFAAALNGLT